MTPFNNAQSCIFSKLWGSSIHHCVFPRSATVCSYVTSFKTRKEFCHPNLHIGNVTLCFWAIRAFCFRSSEAYNELNLRVNVAQSYRKISLLVLSINCSVRIRTEIFVIHSPLQFSLPITRLWSGLSLHLQHNLVRCTPLSLYTFLFLGFARGWDFTPFSDFEVIHMQYFYRRALVL